MRRQREESAPANQHPFIINALQERFRTVIYNNFNQLSNQTGEGENEHVLFYASQNDGIIKAGIDFQSEDDILGYNGEHVPKIAHVVRNIAGRAFLQTIVNANNATRFRDGYVLTAEIINHEDLFVTPIHFKIVHLYELPFASLHFSVNNTELADPLHFLLSFGQKATLQGVLGGYTRQEILSLFRVVTVIVTTSYEGEAMTIDVNANNDFGRVKHYSINLGSINIDDFLKLSETDDIVTFLKRSLDKYIKDREEAFVSSDYEEFIKSAVSAVLNPESYTTGEIIQRTIEEITLKFLPSGEKESYEETELEEDAEEEVDAYAMGCIPDKTKRLESDILRDKHLWTPLNQQNRNCFYQCVRQAYLLNKRERRLDFLNSLCNAIHRKDLNLKDEEDVRKIEAIHHEIKTNFQFYHITKVNYHALTDQMEEDKVESRIKERFEQCKTITTYGYKHINYFIIHKGHCYLVTNNNYVINKVKCDFCSHWINYATFRKHAEICRFCNECMRAYTTKKEHECQGKVTFSKRMEMIRLRKEHNESMNTVCKNWLPMRKNTKIKKPVNQSRIWTADIEAFADAENNYAFTPYAIALVNVSDYSTYKYFYGRNAMKDYIEYTMGHLVDGDLYYYNGGRFDNYLHLHAMIKYGYYVDPTTIIKNGGQIMTFKAKEDLKVYFLVFMTE